MSKVGREDMSQFGTAFSGSRIRQYAEETANRHVSGARMAELETEVEESERRNLRLTRELMEETALRARSERQRDDAKKQVEELTDRVTELESHPVKKPVKRARKARAAKAKPVKKATSKPRPTARKRGTAK